MRDDGRGFDLADPHHDSLGIESMKERALALGGRLTLDSTPGRGTIVVLECPLAPTAASGAV